MNKDIKQLRAQHGLTQKQLAALLGYKSTSVVRKAERGEASKDIIKRILDALDENKPSPSSFEIYTDGGCDVNPGGRGGYGVVIIDRATGEYREISGGYDHTTNNRMEIVNHPPLIEAGV